MSGYKLSVTYRGRNGPTGS